MKKTHKPELLLINVLLALFVIFIHVTSFAISTADRTSVQYAILLPFWRAAACAVPGFFFLAGIKISLGLDRPFSYPKYLLGRFQRVIVPYIIANVVYFLYFVSKNYMDSSIPEFIKNLFIGNIGAHFYFVVTIVQFYVLVPFWRLLAKWLDSWVRISITLIISLYIGYLFGHYLSDFLFIFNKDTLFAYSDRVFTTYLFWWILGLVVGCQYDTIREAFKRDIIPLSINFAFALIFSSALNHIHFTGIHSVWWLATVHYYYVFSAIIFIFAAAVKIVDSIKAMPKFLTLIDSSSYLIYLWHPLFLYFGDEIAAITGLTSIFPKLIIRAVYGYVITVAACILFTFLTGRVKKLLARKTIENK